MAKRTKPHLLYKEPSIEDIDLKFKEINFKGNYSYNLVKDLANAASFKKYNSNVSEALLPIKGGSRKDRDYHKNIQKFLTTVDFNAFSGNTPLSKAASIVIALSSKEGGTGTEVDDDDNNTIPIFSGKSEKDIEKTSVELKEHVKASLEASESIAKYVTNPDNETPEVALCNMTSEQLKLIENLAVLRTKSKITSRKNPDVNKIVQMTSYGQVSKMQSLSSMVLPTFKYRLATKQLRVKERKNSEKQALILLIDDSGSMCYQPKIAWVKSLILNRLDAVAKGEAELIIAWFVTSIDFGNSVKITTKEQAIAFIKKDFYGTFGAGGTNIQNAVREACDCVNKNKFGRHPLNGIRPQIVVINDGDDDVDKSYKPEITTHGFILGRDNNDMKSMINNCNGLYEKFSLD